MNALSPVAARPPHVSEASIYDFDMYMDAGLISDPHARLPEFRLDPDRPATFHAGNIIAIDSLPIVWG